MKLNKKANILIVGLGLMGGSYGMSLMKQGYSVKAISRRQATIDYAVEHKIIEEGTIEIDEDLVSQADFVVFALYPKVFVQWIRDHGQLFKKGALITDVTGIKVPIVYEIQDLLEDGVEFIPSHPMAGREVYGVENATDAIFKDANFIVTPTEKNSQEAIELCKDFGRILGFANISCLSPEDHDDMIGFLSQLAHCIAIALMNSNNSDHLVDYTGDSFRDLTRIAKINEHMWTELFLLNKENLLHHIQAFENELDALKVALKEEDTQTLKTMMRSSTQRRKLFDK